MVWYDVVVLIVLFFAGLRGAQRGLVTQLAWIGAIVLSFSFSDKLAPALKPHIAIGDPDSPARHWVAMFVLFVGFAIGAFIVASTIERTLEKAKLKELDRFLGGVLGLMFGTMIVLVVTFFTSVWPPTRAAVMESRFGRWSCELLDEIKPLTPEYFHEYLAEYQKRLPHDAHTDLDGAVPADPDEFSTDAPSNGGFQLPDLIGGFSGNPPADNQENTGSPYPSGPTLDQLMRALPRQLQQQFGRQIEQKWNAATPQQREQFLSELKQAFDFEVPRVVAEFLASAGRAESGQGTGSQNEEFRRMLNEIGDVYRDRETIVRRTLEYLAGVPAQVQMEVIRDWYADVTMQPTDPDPATDLQTRLDERILRQLARARVPLTSLNQQLRQRLGRSRQ